ncbi:hypothetical protein HDU82_004928 [Entophlyctis luteolus]|nr:hypothetical protein HDU82_004928 [Entophlyctis luteolus]
MTAPAPHIYRPLSYYNLTELLVESTPANAHAGACGAEEMLIVQRGNAEMPHLRAFWQQDGHWHQQAPFLFTDCEWSPEAQPDNGTALPRRRGSKNSLEGLVDGQPCWVGDSVFKTVLVHKNQAVLVRNKM